MRGGRAWGVVVTVGLGCAACSPTYAPPVRTPSVGAPMALDQREVSVAAGLNSSLTGGSALAVGLTDHLAVEGGTDHHETWHVGFLGLRYTPVDGRPQAGRVVRAGFDVEAGAGAGVGGELCGGKARDELDPGDECWIHADGLDPLERGAGGAYLGYGLGLHVKWFSLYGRLRGQLTGAHHVPATTWGIAALGVQVTILRFGYMYLATEYAGWRNELDDGRGWTVLDGGMGLRLGAGNGRTALEDWRARRASRGRGDGRGG